MSWLKLNFSKSKVKTQLLTGNFPSWEYVRLRHFIWDENLNITLTRAVWKLYTFDRELIRVPSSIKEELVLNTGLWLVNTDHVTWILASDWLSQWKETISFFLFVPWGAVVWGGVSITVLFTFHHYHTWVLLFYLELHFFREDTTIYTMQCT